MPAYLVTRFARGRLLLWRARSATTVAVHRWLLSSLPRWVFASWMPRRQPIVVTAVPQVAMPGVLVMVERGFVIPGVPGMIDGGMPPSFLLMVLMLHAASLLTIA